MLMEFYRTGKMEAPKVQTQTQELPLSKVKARDSKGLLKQDLKVFKSMY